MSSEWVVTVLVLLGFRDPLQVELRIANSRVMGAHAVTTTAVLMAVSGLMQVTGVGGSATLSAYGGPWLDRVWSWTLVLAAVLVLFSRWREKTDVVDAAWLEIGAILMISSVLGIFIAIVMELGLTTGAVFLLSAFLALALNLLARAALLLKRIIWLGKAAKK